MERMKKIGEILECVTEKFVSLHKDVWSTERNSQTAKSEKETNDYNFNPNA